jgi:hypothetical protein
MFAIVDASGLEQRTCIELRTCRTPIDVDRRATNFVSINSKAVFASAMINTGTRVKAWNLEYFNASIVG